jgi:hypothetical protein
MRWSRRTMNASYDRGLATSAIHPTDGQRCENIRIGVE